MLRNFVWVYFILFFLIWSMRELWLIHYLDIMEPTIRAFVSAIIKITIWIIPVIIIVQKLERKNPFTYLGLRQNFTKGILWTGILSFVLISFFIIIDKEINLDKGLHSWLNVVILAGLTEEIVFREYLLNKISEFFKFRLANIVTSLLFVFIHFPIWFRTGLFTNISIISTIATIFFISCLFGFIYNKTGSLWSVIILHSVYNYCAVVFN